MKIAFIVTEFPCITETFILNQITGLLDRGHNVTIFALFSDTQPVVHADVAKYHLSERTFYYGRSHQPRRGKNHLRFAKALGSVITSFHKRPVSLLRALYAGILRENARSLRSLPQLARFLNKDIQSYDIVHCHFGPNGNLGAWLKGLGAVEGRLVTAFHGYDISEYTKRKGNQIYGSLFEAGDWFLPVSERWKKRLIELGCPEQRTSIHRMGVDTTRFPFVPRKPRGDGKTHLLTVGRLVEKKGVQYGVQAVTKVLKKNPHVEYTIVGDGPLGNDLNAW